MPEKWNRKTRRQMSNLGIGQKIVQEQLDKTYKEAREYAIREAWSAMMLALYKENGFDRESLHRLAVATVNNINKFLCPADMVNELKSFLALMWMSRSAMMSLIHLILSGWMIWRCLNEKEAWWIPG